MAYCYIVKGTETPIVGVWGAYERAVEAAKDHAKDSGVNRFVVKDINDEYTVIDPLEYDTYERVEVLRYDIQ